LPSTISTLQTATIHFGSRLNGFQKCCLTKKRLRSIPPPVGGASSVVIGHLHGRYKTRPLRGLRYETTTPIGSATKGRDLQSGLDGIHPEDSRHRARHVPTIRHVAPNTARGGGRRGRRERIRRRRCEILTSPGSAAQPCVVLGKKSHRHSTEQVLHYQLWALPFDGIAHPLEIFIKSTLRHRPNDTGATDLRYSRSCNDSVHFRCSYWPRPVIVLIISVGF